MLLRFLFCENNSICRQVTLAAKDHAGADDALLYTNWLGSGATEQSVSSSSFPDL